MTGLNASNLSGTISLAQLPGSLVSDTDAVVTLSNLTLSGALSLPSPAIIYAGAYPTLIDEGSFFAGGAGNRTLTGVSDVGVGKGALHAVSSGSYNTALGEQALMSNTAGLDNTAIGFGSLLLNMAGSNNMANGYEALYNNGNGTGNTAIGYEALYFNNSFYNTAAGMDALGNNTSGPGNTADGAGRLRTTRTALSTRPLAIMRFTSTRPYPTILRWVGRPIKISSAGSNNIDIGNLGVGEEQHPPNRH